MKKTHPRPPTHLTADSKQFWTWAVREFVLEPHHVGLLKLLCEHRDAAESARQILATHGSTFTDRFGQIRARPEVAQFRDSTIAVARLTRELRLDDPASESRPPRIGGR